MPLGFRLTGNTGSNRGFRSLRRCLATGMAFFLTEHTGDCSVGGLVHLYVPDVDEWFDEFQRKGVRVQEPPNEGLPGLRSMTLLDPDGNKLHICTRLADWHR